MTSFSNILSENWKLRSSENTDLVGEEISSPGCDTGGWFPVDVPSTVLASLVKNHHYNDPYFGTNMKDIPREPFQVPWWYRTDFDLHPEQAGKTVLISFDGLNYKANIWLNGQQIATSQTANGAFRRLKLNITEHVVPGKNVLAVEIIPPKDGDFSIGFVDWNIDPPDRNMGIFREVTLHFNEGVSIENPFVETDFNTEIPEQAAITVTTELMNHTGSTVSGILKGSIDKLQFSQPVTLAPGEQKCVSFAPDEFLGLNVLNPELWWPNNLGRPSLYKLELLFEDKSAVFDFN
ncbi:MAG: glycoside hydrolase family 2, partial [Bacteroidales bacterium]|nr:glycoside hydrolase family 2 [Bacteroidales bacterium]